MFRKLFHKDKAEQDKAISEQQRLAMKEQQISKINSNAKADGKEPITEQQHDDVMSALGMPGYK